MKETNMKTTISNKFHNFSKTINHNGSTPSVSTLRKAIRDSKPSDCKSTTTIYREDGASLRMDGSMIVVIK